jgi:hypothetical protein
MFAFNVGASPAPRIVDVAHISRVVVVVVVVVAHPPPRDDATHASERDARANAVAHRRRACIAHGIRRPSDATATLATRRIRRRMVCVCVYPGTHRPCAMDDVL